MQTPPHRPQLSITVVPSRLLTQAEEEVGSIFYYEQKLVLQNKLAAIAQDKMNLPFTPNDIHSYIQREAELAGQLVLLQWLLDTSDQMELVVKNRSDQQQSSSQQE